MKSKGGKYVITLWEAVHLFKARFMGPGSVTRYALLGACLIALWFAIPMARQEIRTSQARNALANAAKTAGGDHLAFLNEAKKALTPPGPTSELYDLAAQLVLLRPPIDMNAAESLTRKALERSPARAESWARLAYIELLRKGTLTDKALEYLDHSFVVEPAGYKQFMLWRLEFMFSHWSQLSPSLQEATMRSFRIMAQWRGKGFALKLAKKAGNADLESRVRQVLDMEETPKAPND